MAVGPKVEIILAEIFNFYGKTKVHRLLSGSDAVTSNVGPLAGISQV